MRAALVRVYRLGQARFTRLFIEEHHRRTGMDQIDGATTLRAIDQVAQYIDRVVGLLLLVYERERTCRDIELQGRRRRAKGHPCRLRLDGPRARRRRV
jgi:hypothetical protein